MNLVPFVQLGCFALGCEARRSRLQFFRRSAFLRFANTQVSALRFPTGVEVRSFDHGFRLL